jgi:hypothetical protein
MENINVTLRIRPNLKDELSIPEQNYLFKVEGNSIINLKNKDIFTYGKPYFWKR